MFAYVMQRAIDYSILLGMFAGKAAIVFLYY